VVCDAVVVVVVVVVVVEECVVRARVCVRPARFCRVDFVVGRAAMSLLAAASFAAFAACRASSASNRPRNIATSSFVAISRSAAGKKLREI
jgi:tRNA threonylcarbamoyladenosine modification (KEOPS) complex Cgi121 subunit